MKDRLMFAAEVAVVLVAIGFIQSKVFSLPVVGAYLPGYTPKV